MEHEFTEGDRTESYNSSYEETEAFWGSRA